MKMIFPFLMIFLKHPFKTIRYAISNVKIRKDTVKILKYQRLCRLKKDIKPVYFFGPYKSISFKLGGSYILEALRQSGIKAYSGYYTNVDSIYDSIVVIVQRISEEIDVMKLKKNGNRIIFDIHDAYCLWKEETYRLIDIADFIIYPNRTLVDEISKDKKKTYTVLYGYADPAIYILFREKKYKNFDTIKCCYFGYKRNAEMKILNKLQKEISLTLLPSSLESIKKLTDFNMHIDVRKDKVKDDILYKPLTKILIAAECNSNIIVEKTPRTLEILPEDYPFFISKDKIEEDIKRIKSLFGTEKWRYGLSVMADIRNKYTFSYHLQSFIKILEGL
ncbi:MAG: hypothetical protein N3D17_05295 [bacterium]|nr:hypothetical protein [bacterium]